MAVLIEALSVVMKVAAVRERFPGGWMAFAQIVTNGTLCSDKEICRVGFLRPEDLKDFIEQMMKLGFVYADDKGAVDMVVIGQEEGLMQPCDWIEAGTTHLQGNEIVAARLVGSRVNELVTPHGWVYEGSVSQIGQRIAT
jgi:hypothetical protein